MRCTCNIRYHKDVRKYLGSLHKKCGGGRRRSTVSGRVLNYYFQKAVFGDDDNITVCKNVAIKLRQVEAHYIRRNIEEEGKMIEKGMNIVPDTAHQINKEG
eukprot:2880557-Ditylum_brightwellii.AAC.1